MVIFIPNAGLYFLRVASLQKNYEIDLPYSFYLIASMHGGPTQTVTLKVLSRQPGARPQLISTHTAVAIIQYPRRHLISMSIQRLLRYRTTGILRVVIVLLTQSNCTSIFDVAFDNDVLELGGDWP